MRQRAREEEGRARRVVPTRKSRCRNRQLARALRRLSNVWTISLSTSPASDCTCYIERVPRRMNERQQTRARLHAELNAPQSRVHNNAIVTAGE